MFQQRRTLLLSIAAWPLAATAQPVQDLAARLRSGRCAILMRHGQTDPGVGDPPGFVMGQCATQRNLSEAGRAQSRATGAWFRERGLQPSAVLSSAWCRCIDTAQLAFGRQEPWAPLDSSFGRGEARDEARLLLLERLSRIGAGRFEVWVTHQVNISAFAGEATSMGEGLLVDASGKVLGRSSFS
ncbi:histidine phosphatase family protein [Variovorax sp. OV329]|uniref:histidine phosphatase family protein n=1 Tax=Variovorax sp. OV329 TaxID=1882825 RepID=UPI0008EE3A7C|nr:histidine phosphatase family protein [Variovorax sp. OV329]SFM05565.1 Histidine phosphatase superfamily (branch 1) [Variovorax sp. OV329]